MHYVGQTNHSVPIHGSVQPLPSSHYIVFSSLTGISSLLDLSIARTSRARVAVDACAHKYKPHRTSHLTHPHRKEPPAPTQALFFNHLYDPISLVRDNEVKAAMAAAGVVCQSFNSDLLFEPWDILSATGQPLTSFNDYWGRCAWDSHVHFPLHCPQS